MSDDNFPDRTWGAAQLATLEKLASDSVPKFKSRRYDRRQLNGDRRFGALMAERRRSLADQNGSARAGQQPLDENDRIDRAIAYYKEILRVRSGVRTY